MKKELEIIISKLRSGDEKFYKSVFFEYYPVLTIFANKYVNNLDVAKEIVQDFFVKLYEKRHTLNIESSFKSYLYKSVYNSCINYLKQNVLRDRHHRQIEYLTDEKTTLSDEEMNAAELEQRIYTEIEQLPEQCKRIFKMNRFDGISNSNIAERLHLSKRTVETQISKALKILRKRISDEYF